MDISDGLLKDAARLASASDVLISLNRSQLPLSDAYRQRCEGNDLPALTGGEDYVLLFTARPETPLPDWAIPIGMCADGRGVTLDGQEVDTRGYDHFVGAE
jgi:thiamine-monophosphate kinase